MELHLFFIHLNDLEKQSAHVPQYQSTEAENASKLEMICDLYIVYTFPEVK